MSLIIPESPQFHSAGERSLATLLSRLPDDCVVYHEPRFHRCHADFLVISPRFGILVIETKAWTPKQIIDGDLYQFTVEYQGKPLVCQHPAEQARRYQHDLHTYCLAHVHLAPLVGKSGRLRFPLGHAVVLTGLTRGRLEKHSLSDLFRREETVTADLLREWSRRDDAAAFERELMAFMGVQFSFRTLDGAEMDLLRAAINPSRRIRRAEVDVEDPAEGAPVVGEGRDMLCYLDDKQESAALGLGTGHRLLPGVAGSGKTLVLQARARYLAAVDPEAKVLVLCYNRALAAWLRFQLREVKDNVEVKNFHALAWKHGARGNRSDEDLGQLLLERLKSSCPDYDAVLIDEGQDFVESWYRCAVAALKDPVDGDLVVAMDGAQGLYGRRGFTWSAVGIRARGRVETRRLGLDYNYRNTRSIVTAAAKFAHADDGKNGNDSQLSLVVDPERSIARQGVPLAIWLKANRGEETRFVYLAVKRALRGVWGDTRVEPLRPEEIGILYPPLPADDLGGSELKGWLRKLVVALRDLCPTVWLTDPDAPRGRNPRDAAASPGIKVQTIHSAKGLQYRAVIMLWSDLLPSAGGNGLREESDRKLFYVGLTRAESLLAMTQSRSSRFLEEVAESVEGTGDRVVALTV